MLQFDQEGNLVLKLEPSFRRQYDQTLSALTWLLTLVSFLSGKVASHFRMTRKNLNR